MGDGLTKIPRKVLDAVDDAGKKSRKLTNQTIEKPFRTGASAAARDAKSASLLQQQKDQKAIAETEDEIARRRAGAGGGAGRRSLIASSPTGLAKTLGGA